MRTPTIVLTAILLAPLPIAAETAYTAKSKVALKDGFWEINGKPTHAGTLAEGLLMNVRMVHATFEDRNAKTAPKGFDADKNTEAFIAAIPKYAASGISAFTLGLQGGNVGYEGALNSAIEPDGSLREASMARVAKVIEACDKAGIVAILGCFHHSQDQTLKDAAAVKTALTNIVNWINKRGYKNVVLEVIDEVGHAGFDHEVFKNPDRVADLLQHVKKAAPELLVSASGDNNGRTRHPVGNASHFVLVHFDGVPVGTISPRVVAAAKYAKAVVCNRDPKTGSAGAEAAQATVDSLCSWGYANYEKNETYPFSFDGPADDPPVYAKIKELTSK